MTLTESTNGGSNCASRNQNVLRTRCERLVDLLDKRKTEVENLIRSVKGFVSYTIARTGDGGFTITICDDKAGIDESLQRAKEWVAKNAGNIGSAGTPKVTEGSVIVHAK